MAETAVGIAVTGQPPRRRWSLRLPATSVAQAGAALGLAVPTEVGATARSPSWRIICLGPDEWELETTDEGAVPPPLPRPHALVEISDRDAAWTVAGPRALDVLAAGIARDLAGLGVGEGCRTAFDGVSVIVLREGEETFSLRVARSYATWLSTRLAAGVREHATDLE